MAKNQRRPYRGPNYARDPRLRETMGGDGPLKVTDSRKTNFTPTERRTMRDPQFPRGPVQGLDDLGRSNASADWWMDHHMRGLKVGGPTNRMIRGGKWGLGAAGVGTLGYGGHRTINRKGKKMDVRKNADIPFKTRSASPIYGSRKPGQLPFTEHYVNRNASPRQLGVQRFKGTSGNRTGKLVVIGKADKQPNARNVKRYRDSAKEIVGTEAKWGGIGAVGGGLAGLAAARSSAGRRAIKEGAQRKFLVGNSAMLGGWGGAAVGGNVALVRDAQDRQRRLKAAKGGVAKSALPTRVTSVQPRTPQGKFVGTANDVQVFHPKFKSSNRQPRTSTLQHYTRKKKDQYASGFEKSLFGGGTETSMALSGGLNLAQFTASQGRKGVRFDKEQVSKWAGHQQGKTLAGTFGRGGVQGPGSGPRHAKSKSGKHGSGFSLKPRAPFRRETVNNSVFDTAGGNFISRPNTSRWARNRPRRAA